MRIEIVVTFFCLFLTGCNLLGGNGSQPVVEIGRSLKDVDLSNAGMDIKENYGIKIDTPTVNISPTTKVEILKNYDSPVVNVDRQKIVIFEANQKNAKVVKTYKKYAEKTGQILVDETEVVTPVPVKEDSRGMLAWLEFGMILLSTGILGGHATVKGTKAVFSWYKKKRMGA